MALADLLTQVVTIEHAVQAVSRVGDPVIEYRRWGKATDTESAFIESVESREDEFLRDFNEARFHVYFHPWVTIAPLDRIIWGTRVLEVVGPPRRMHRPAGLHHLIVSAVEVSG